MPFYWFAKINEKELGNIIEAFNSVPTAIYCFLTNPNFEEAVVYAVSLGGDADAIGAMTEAIAGAYWGVEAIPQRWRNKIDTWFGRLLGVCNPSSGIFPPIHSIVGIEENY